MALDWYNKAAEAGSVAAQNNLGYMYATGQGVTQNDETAVEWYRLTADAGNDIGQFNLGWMYATGRGVQTGRPGSRCFVH